MLIQFDNHIYGHNGKGRGKDGYCWWCDYMSDEGKTWEYVPIDDKKENEDGLEEVV
jgi:hypothetical protein